MTNLIFVGDIMLGRKVGESSNSNIFKHVKDVLKSSDITFANLESPLCNGMDFIENKKYVFFAKEEFAELLKPNGFDVLSLANNHIIDCNGQGIDNTLKVLKKYGLSFVGLNENGGKQKPLVIEKNGIKIGFLAYCKDRVYLRNLKIGPYLINKNILKEVKKAKKEVDFLVISLHWGREYKTEPSKSQKVLGKALIDNGADVIIGHHAHIVQRIEKYKQGIIAYSLGNFVFDQMFNEKVRKSIILKVILNGDKIKKYECINSYINDRFEPELK